MTGWGQKKLSKESSDGRSGAGGGGGGDDRQLSAEFRKKLDEWQRMKGSVDTEEPPPSAGAGKSLLLSALKLSSHVLFSGNPEAGMLDLRRRMGMDPWHRREKSAGKPDIQVIFSGPVSMSSVMSKLQRKTAQFTKNLNLMYISVLESLTLRPHTSISSNPQFQVLLHHFLGSRRS